MNFSRGIGNLLFISKKKKKKKNLGFDVKKFYIYDYMSNPNVGVSDCIKYGFQKLDCGLMWRSR